MKKIYLFFFIVLSANMVVAQCGTNVSASNASCYGACDGAITLTPAGGTPPYSLSINGVAVTPFASTYIKNNACPGMYHWVLTDALASCSDSGDVAITQPSSMAANMTAVPNLCSGDNNGSATVVVAGGTPPYNYSWTPTGGNASTASNLVAGIYVVAISDANGCWLSTNAVISQPSPVLASVIPISMVSCYGGNNGSAFVSPGGGVSPYTFFWVPGGATTPTVTNLPAGNHAVTVTDANGCSAIESIAITQPSSLNLTVSSITHVNCFGANTGSICVTASGGVSPYNYTWSPSGNAALCPTNLPAGQYTAATQDANGCIAFATATVNEPPPFSLSVGSLTNVSCYGGNTGAVTLVASGGTPPYTNTNFSGLPAMTHSLTVADMLGCAAVATVSISQPASPLIVGDSMAGQNCLGGSNGTGCVFVLGGTSPYSILWSPSLDTTLCASGLTTGNYLVQATDAQGCLAVDTLQINQSPAIAVNISPTLALCSYIPDWLCANVIGGTPPFSYAWNTGFATGNCNVSSPTVPTNYFVTVTDSIGCTATDSLLVNPVTPVTAVVYDIPPSCGQCDGIVEIFPSGGTPGYTYDWTPPISGGICENVTYFLNVIDLNGCTDSLVLSYPSQCDSVWPGDANADGIADNFDILIVGAKYGEFGPARPGASIAWAPQICPNWTDSLANGVNDKHHDCDGNGLVNASDTLPVSLNYGMTHLRGIPHAYQATWPDFSLKVSVDSAGLNQALRVKLYLGSGAIPVPAIYGIAFTLELDPLLVDTATASFDYSSSALGTAGVDMLTFQHTDFSSGKIDLALTRTDHTDVALNDSLIAEFSVRVAASVSALSTLQFSLADVKAITWPEDELNFNLRGDSVVINPAITGIHPVNEVPSAFVFPVPVKDRLIVKSPALIYSAGLFNELGARVFFNEYHQKSLEIETLDFPDGIYFLQLNTASGWITKKINLVK